MALMRLLTTCVLSVATVLAGFPSAGQENVDRQYAIKAAYLYNFGRYVQWPDASFSSRKAPFVIGILGTDPFGGDLDRIAAAKKMGGRPIVIRRFNSLDDYTPCHLLFVPRGIDPQAQRAAIERLARAHVLLVGETPHFARRGGTINFFNRQNKVRFKINQAAADRSRLKISAKLLRLAELVEDDTRQEQSTTDKPS